jgi:hypothetical protein
VIQQSHSWGYIQRNATQVTPEAPAHLCLLQPYGNSQDAPPLTNGLRKCGIYIQWNFTQPWRRMKSYHSQVNGWNWRTSLRARSARLRNQKSYVLPHMWTLAVGQMQQCGWTWIHDKGRAHTGDIGIGRKPKTWQRLMSPLQRSQYRNLKATKVIMRRGSGTRVKIS